MIGHPVQRGGQLCREQFAVHRLGLRRVDLAGQCLEHGIGGMVLGDFQRGIGRDLERGIDLALEAQDGIASYLAGSEDRDGEGLGLEPGIGCAVLAGAVETALISADVCP